jgi:hypothetical protein
MNNDTQRIINIHGIKRYVVMRSFLTNADPFFIGFTLNRWCDDSLYLDRYNNYDAMASPDTCKKLGSYFQDKYFTDV